MQNGVVNGARRWSLLAAATGLLLACTDSDPPEASDAPATTATELVESAPPSAAPPTTDPATTPPSTTAAPAPRSTDCPEPAADAVPWAEGDSAAMQPLLERDDGLRVRAAVYPGPSESGNPWSQWGQGAVTSDGRFLSAVGDHLGADGNSYLYEYDPATGELTMVGDVLSLVDHQPGAWGYGKIHAQMVVAACDQVYVSTYWGTRRDIRFGGGYEGDLLLRLDPLDRTTAVLGVPVPRHGTPSMGGANGLVYGEAADPTHEENVGQLFLHDVESGETTIVDDSADHVGFRSLAVDADGRAYFTKPASRLTRYDPATGELTTLDDPLPGEVLRAATPPAPDGTIYGVTDNPRAFFALRPDGSIEPLGEAPGYIASLAMEPDGSLVYFVPGAHGDGWTSGTPLMALDTATGEQSVVVELNPLTEEGLGLTAGGTYNVVLDEANRRLFVGLNAARTETREDTTFGEVVLAEITLPGGPAAAPAGTDLADVEGLTCWATPPPPVAGSAPSWEDVTAETGLDRSLSGMMGHAAAWGDLDGDSVADLALGTFADRPPEDYGAGGPSPDRVVIADRDGGRWRDSGVQLGRGRTSGAVFADLDLDDDLDLVLARNATDATPEPTTIWRNDGGHLERVGDPGLDPASPGRSIGVLHLDGDDRPDLVILEDRFRGGSSRLYRNLGDLRFEPFTAGWPADVHGLGLATGDLDGDGHTDLVVGGSNRVFAGTGSGLREVAGALEPWETYGDEDDPAGVDLGDVDRDGDLDVVIGQHFNSTISDGEHEGEEVPVRLYVNESTPGSIVLRDVTEAAGLVGLPTKAPHVALVDLDNDGGVDLLTTASVDGGTGPAVFLNTGRGGAAGVTFRPPDGLGDEQYWVSGPMADVDHDGRLDVFLVEWFPDRTSRLLRNTSPAGHFLAVGVDASLGGGPGTRVAAYEAGQAGRPDALVALAEISVSQGYGGGVEPVAHLGLGDRESVDLVVTPPPGREPITLSGVPADRRLHLPNGC